MDSITEQYGVDPAATGSARSEPVVSVRGLVKRYGSNEAVAGIDLEVRRGEIFAFLGPNGAGKTTTVEILEGCPSGSAWPCTPGSTARRGTSTRPSPWSVSPARRARSAPGCPAASGAAAPPGMSSPGSGTSHPSTITGRRPWQ
jgi:hypothetical protein